MAATFSVPIGTLESAFLIAICILSIFGNVTVIVTIYRNPHLHNSFNVFIANFALVCLSNNIALIPKWSIVANKLMCVCFHAHWAFTTAVWLWSFAFMALNRYYRVVKPSSFPYIFTTRRSVKAAAASWVVLAVLSIVLYAALLPIFEFKLKRSHCLALIGVTELVLGNLLLLFIFIAPPNIITLFFYFKTSWFIKKQQNSIWPISSRMGEVRMYAEERKTLRVLLVLLVAGLCCMTASLTFWLLIEVMQDPPFYLSYLEDFSTYLLGVVFPIVYIFVSKHYRNELLKLISCRCCCRKSEETRD